MDLVPEARSWLVLPCFVGHVLRKKGIGLVGHALRRMLSLLATRLDRRSGQPRRLGQWHRRCGRGLAYRGTGLGFGFGAGFEFGLGVSC